MAINVAGTNAIGDYLVSEIANTRTLFGLAPESSALPVSSVPGGSSSAAPATSPNTLQTQVLAQKAANEQTLFGVPAASTQSSDALPTDPNQTPAQAEFAAIQSADIAAEFSNTATLFSSIGLGINTNVSA